ncbi:MAG: hypothetical protein JNM56_15285 [Planctomycetia bacterium]|nr:hypothetical protein [Planctomycetia bacterium]
MDAEHLQASAERDQLWASLRQLRPHIEALATGNATGSPLEKQVIELLAKIVLAELDYRARD